jgi:hypothetical protein
LSDATKIVQKLEEVAQELENDMKRGGWTGRTVTLKFKLDTYQGWRLTILWNDYYSAKCSVFTRAKSFDKWITTKEELFTVRSHTVQTRGHVKATNNHNSDRKRTACTRDACNPPVDRTPFDKTERSQGGLRSNYRH